MKHYWKAFVISGWQKMRHVLSWFNFLGRFFFCQNPFFGPEMINFFFFARIDISHPWLWWKTADLFAFFLQESPKIHSRGNFQSANQSSFFGCWFFYFRLCEFQPRRLNLILGLSGIIPQIGWTATPIMHPLSKREVRLSKFGNHQIAFQECRVRKRKKKKKQILEKSLQLFFFFWPEKTSSFFLQSLDCRCLSNWGSLEGEVFDSGENHDIVSSSTFAWWETT